MRTCKSQKISTMMSRFPKIPLSLVTATFIFLLLTAAVCSFAWLAGKHEKAVLRVNSDGVHIEAELAYLEEINYRELPADEKFTQIQNIDELREVTENFQFGSTLAYRMKVTNTSKTPNNSFHASGLSADIALSFSDIGSYFYEAYLAYATAVEDAENAGPGTEPDFTATDAIIEANSGAIMFRFMDIQYKLNDGERVVCTELSENNAIFRDYSSEEVFFAYENLAPEDTLYIYFMLESMVPTELISQYQNFRKAEGQEFFPNFKDKTHADYKAYRNYLKLLDKEIASLIIEYDSENPGAGAIKTATFHIDYIQVEATQHIPEA